MKKVFAMLLVGMLAVFGFAAFEVTGGYANTSFSEEDLGTASDIMLHGISGGANYLFEGLGIEGGALLIGGSIDYYFPSDVDELEADGEVIDITDYGLSMNLSQTSFGVNGGYRQNLNAFFPDLPFRMYVQGLFDYSFGTVIMDLSGTVEDPTSGTSVTIDEEEEWDSSSWGFGGGAGASFVVQNLDINVGADVLFEKTTWTYEGDEEDLQWKPKFKIHAGLQF